MTPKLRAWRIVRFWTARTVDSRVQILVRACSNHHQEVHGVKTEEQYSTVEPIAYKKIQTRVLNLFTNDKLRALYRPPRI